MIGIFLIYFIGRAFYQLAFEYKKHQWGYAILGVASYYAGSILGGILLVVFAALFFDSDITTWSDIALSIISVPFGGLVCLGLYKILENSWEKNAAMQPGTEGVLDGDLRSGDAQ